MPPAVRFEVRVGRDQPTTLPFARAEFLIGGASGCDLRLTGSHLPPVIGRVAHAADGLTFRKVDPAFPVLLNGVAVTDSGPVLVANGDRLAVGPVDVTVHITTVPLRPRFVLFDSLPPDRIDAIELPASSLHATAGEVPPGDHSPSVAAERAELARLRSRIDEQLYNRRRTARPDHLLRNDRGEIAAHGIAADRRLSSGTAEALGSCGHPFIGFDAVLESGRPAMFRGQPIVDGNDGAF